MREKKPLGFEAKKLCGKLVEGFGMVLEDKVVMVLILVLLVNYLFEWFVIS